MGTCSSCRYAAPDARALRCVHPLYHWTFRAGPTYGCARYEAQPQTVLAPHPRQSSEALAERIRRLLGGPHYQVDLSTRQKVQALTTVWRDALAFEASADRNHE